MGSHKKDLQNSPEWRVPMPEGASATGAHDEAGPAPAEGAWPRLLSRTTVLRTKVFGFGDKVWKIGADDPRKAVYGIKLGVALTLVSLLYYVRPMYNDIGGNAVWAIMTVVLAFEYTVGGTVYKGLNGTAGTMSAAVLALGVHWVASKSGHRFEPVVASGSVFLLAAAAAFSRFVPIVTARFDYGVTAFTITYGYIAVSGYRVGELPLLALQRISSYSIGVFICIAVSALVCPVWSGDELHLLTARNMEKLAAAVEGCVADCFARGPLSKRPQAARSSEGYKCVLDSKAAEDAHGNLAWWELRHGRFGFRHHHEQYAQIGAAMRRCAFCLESLSSCGAKAQASEHAVRVVGEVCTRLGAQCARVLKEASHCMSTTTMSRELGLAMADTNATVLELQADLRALPSKLAEDDAVTSLMEAMPLLSVALLMVEVSARVKGVVDAVDVLATLGGFKRDDVGGAGKVETKMKVPVNDATAQHLTTIDAEQGLKQSCPTDDKQVTV
ncbi:hypothetical protein ACP70R_027580 [Stipagrostis hirtigluma subsp. patula]